MNGNAPSEDVARLNGARFVNISEPDRKLTLSAALVKSLTGNDTIIARFLHENSFEYRPQFKMFVNTNYLPQITDLTLFSSGRVKTIPFNRHFEEHEQDRGLKELFARPEHLSGILNWCIEGLEMLEKEGFDAPDVVRAATSEYAHNSDKLALFMEECLETMPNALTRTSEVYRCYQAWGQENGFHAENTRNFKGLLAGRATIDRRRPSYGGEKTTMLVGYRIRDETSGAYP
jgi:putative DNA primase/helicase